jgi:hypothetical protein
VVVSAALRLSVPQPEVLRYRSNAEPLPPPPAKPFAHRRLRPGEEKLVSESKTVFLPRREKVGFGFHIDENGVVDGLAKTENGAQIATGLSIGMRLLAVDAVYIHSTAEVSELLAKHAVGRAARFELRPAPPAAEEVFAEKKQEKAKQQAAIDAALMAASKPYGKKFEVWEAEEVRNAPRFSASILDRSCQSVDRLSRQARDKSNTSRTQTQILWFLCIAGRDRACEAREGGVDADRFELSRRDGAAGSCADGRSP